MKLRSFAVVSAHSALLALLSGLPAGAQTQATVVGGRLSLSTPGTGQTVKVEVDGNTARIFGFPGLADGTPYSGLSGVAVNTGAGNDKVEVSVITPGSFDVRVDTGSGQSETKLNWKILAGGTAPSANIATMSAPGAQSFVGVEVESESGSASVHIEAGSAAEIAAKVQSSNTSDFLRVAFAGTAPKTSLEIGSHAAALEVDVRAGATAAADELLYKINQSRPAQVNINWAIDSGAGADKIEAIVSASGSTVSQSGTVLGRAGNDLFLFETQAFSTVTGLTLNGGPGNDELLQIIKGRLQSSQSLRTVLLGGDGDDILSLTTDTGIFGSGFPNDQFPVINCGLGNDRFNAFGQILGCEARL